MDMMHIKWLGVDAYYMASLLVYLVEYKLPGSASHNLSSIWQEIAEQYKVQRSPTRLSCLTMKMIKPAKAPFPVLRAKAAEVKNLVPILVQVSSKYLQDNDFERLMHQGLLRSWAIDQCLSANKDLPRF